ncbi:MAG: hypothetical protein KJ958_04510 [Gammaproteobacteria bacterium]|nr:hypothetical protein [Gammaproteobacteria bacterium]MBU1978415.1 hypothetical protein [Gammaproteobacteria bacterium]
MSSTIQTAAELLVREWIKAYNKAPRVTVVATVLSMLIGGFSIYFSDQAARESREAKRLQNFSYAKQVQSLDETRASLQSLLEFVDNEKRNLQVSQQTLQALKNEQERLKPLVESDRKTIDALFSAQEARNQAAQSTERWIGFGLGALSSLVASLVWAGIAYATRRNKSDTAA